MRQQRRAQIAVLELVVAPALGAIHGVVSLHHAITLCGQEHIAILADAGIPVGLVGPEQAPGVEIGATHDRLVRAGAHHGCRDRWRSGDVHHTLDFGDAAWPRQCGLPLHCARCHGDGFEPSQRRPQQQAAPLRGDAGGLLQQQRGRARVRSPELLPIRGIECP